MMGTTAKIGLFGIGLNTYWGQFDGLYDRLEGYHKEISSRISGYGAEVVDAGMVDDSVKAGAAAELFAASDVDLIFLYVSTYALSSTVLPVVRNLNAKVIILNLQPTAAIDYKYLNSLPDRAAKTGEWLAYCQACTVPEIASVFNRADISYAIISGYMEEASPWEKVSSWIDAARVARALRHSRIGVLGHYYGGMLDVYSDLTRLSACFGVHFEILEMCALKMMRDAVTDTDVDAKLNEFYTAFEVSPDCSQDELTRAARTASVLDKLVYDNRLDALAYYYEGEPGSVYEDLITSVIAGNTLLTGRGVPVAGECEIKNVMAMKILSDFGAGGSFAEFYTLDLNDDIVMLGHDGPAHFNMAEGVVKLVPLSVYHGKPGNGLSIEMSVKTGDVTILSVVETKGGVTLLVAEGESVEGPVLETGNTNSRYRFPIPAARFVEEWSKAGPSHHCAIGKGHVADRLSKLCDLLNIPVTKIC